eukprot:CAMPEP_0114575992 /NCGR_PEP_ID=MMETSP0125-20121206/799_1 /TAXON_ID=485358 ORGANISM="Aristerostoma sp., Strain ATCC 50986" /NCGR_SAMPLE_ID=MMETSP0125 /ASSEMBLY_ACC=CAM_ASM_000245 /LENGTH=71 /DNA_ID=CAMNT_0001764151 /DNA_START=467 /DNA_END=682 /DNA_ORIENTATION=+
MIVRISLEFKISTSSADQNKFSISNKNTKKEEESYGDDFENVEEELEEEIVEEKGKKNPMLTSSEDILGAS